MSECCIRIDDSFRLLLPQDLITVGKLPFIPGPSINPGTVYRNDGSFPWTLLDPLDVGVDAGTGLSIGDINNDGLVDVVAQNFGPIQPPGSTAESAAVFLLNRNKKAANTWLKVFLVGRCSNRDGLGAKVKLTSAQGTGWLQKRAVRTQVKAVVSGSSFFSSNDKVITFGMGRWGSARRLHVQWPNGSTQRVFLPLRKRKNATVKIFETCKMHYG